MPADHRVKNAFTLIEFLIALVIIGFIVAILVGVFSNPLKRAKTDSAISQVKDGLRQRAEAAEWLEAQGKCNGNDCYRDAVTLGGLTAQPHIPAGVSGTIQAADWDSTSLMPGGCGANTAGNPAKEQPVLRYVSDEFCKEYNNTHNLGPIIVKNCAPGGDDCSASGSASDWDTMPVASNTYCYKAADWAGNDIILMAGVSNGVCEP